MRFEFPSLLWFLEFLVGDGEMKFAFIVAGFLYVLSATAQAQPNRLDRIDRRGGWVQAQRNCRRQRGGSRPTGPAAPDAPLARHGDVRAALAACAADHADRLC